MFQGFIFDVDGTLIDSVAQNQHSLQDALEKSGYRVPIQTLRLYSGLDGDQTLQLVVPDASDRERITILEDRREIYERDYLPSIKPLEGARDVIRILAEKGGRIALATDCKGLSFTRHMLLLDSRDYITATACGDDLEHGKPDPRLVGIALRKLGVTASQTVMVGDTPYDADNALLQPAPRAAYAKLLTAGWADGMRTVYPDDPMFTFWSYLRNRWPRNAGLRLDHLLLSPAVAPRLKAAGVDRNVRSEPEASDHAPAWIELKSARRGGPKRNRRSPP